MPTVRECVCCMEIDKVQDVIKETNPAVPCIQVFSLFVLIDTCMKSHTTNTDNNMAKDKNSQMSENQSSFSHHHYFSDLKIFIYNFIYICSVFPKNRQQAKLPGSSTFLVGSNHKFYIEMYLEIQVWPVQSCLWPLTMKIRENTAFVVHILNLGMPEGTILFSDSQLQRCGLRFY